MKTRELVYGAVLTALALMIPLMFRGWLQVYIPPFSATLGSHVPSMIAMFISPWVAVLVGVGSTLGFFLTLPAVIGMRAATHIAFGLVGALWYKKSGKIWPAILVALPVHAVLEAIVVIPFGFDLNSALVVIGVGTAIHHLIDGVIAVIVYQALKKSGVQLGESAPTNIGG